MIVEALLLSLVAYFGYCSNKFFGDLELSIFVQCLNPQNYAASANGCSRCLL